VVGVGRGEETLGLTRTANPHLMVLDVMLPNLDSFALCRKLRAGGDAVPVIVLSARDDPAHKHAGTSRLAATDSRVASPRSIQSPWSLRIVPGIVFNHRY
jgi:two-component system OmpR family response regulator